MRAPTHLARLRALTHEAVDGPCVDELARFLGNPGDLGVALGDVHHFDAQPPGQIAPVAARGRIPRIDVGVRGDIQECLLHEVGHEAGIRPVREHSRRSAGVARAQRQDFLAERIVGAAARRHRRIGVAARPRLDAGVQVHRAFFPAQLDERDARHLDRHVDEKVSPPQQGVQDAAEILAGQRLLDELDAQLLCLLHAALVRGHDRDAVWRNANVPEDQGQDSLADAAESDQQDAPGEIDVLLVIAHDSPLSKTPGHPTACSAEACS